MENNLSFVVVVVGLFVLPCFFKMQRILHISASSIHSAVDSDHCLSLLNWFSCPEEVLHRWYRFPYYRNANYCFWKAMFVHNAVTPMDAYQQLKEESPESLLLWKIVVYSDQA